jgi:SNF2 family DNA or RNA helicase
VEPLQLLLRAIKDKYQYPSVYLLSGLTKRTEDKEKILDNFRNDANPAAILLCSTKAGGVGINLVEAQVCIFLNSDWNPQTDMQAVSRLWRGGQLNKVNVFTLVVGNKIEHKVQEVRAHKTELQTWFDKTVRVDGDGVRSAFLPLIYVLK